MEAKKALVIINTMDAGGAETFVMKVYRKIDRNELQLDFLINKQGICYYEKEINALGGRVFRGISKSKHPLKSFNVIKRLVRDEKYEAVFSIAVHPLAFLDLLAAKLGGAKIRLVRSTNSNAGGRISALLAALGRPFVCSLSTLMLAPSTEAGVWLFGRKAVQNGKVHIITNGIEMSDYIFCPEARSRIRAELSIDESTFVVGHVGRFNIQKNHTFLIKIFAEIKKHNPDSILLLVGDGELKAQAEAQVETLGMRDSVIFLGVRNNVPELMMAMDALVFPSLYEGMPNVVIEAQAIGLPCIISDTITNECNITGLVSFLSLQDTPVKWSIVSLKIHGVLRHDMSKIISEKGYSIKNTASFLTNRLLDRTEQ